MIAKDQVKIKLEQAEKKSTAGAFADDLLQDEEYIHNVKMQGETKKRAFSKTKYGDIVAGPFDWDPFNLNDEIASKSTFTSKNEDWEAAWDKKNLKLMDDDFVKEQVSERQSSFISNSDVQRKSVSNSAPQAEGSVVLEGELPKSSKTSFEKVKDRAAHAVFHECGGAALWGTLLYLPAHMAVSAGKGIANKMGWREKLNVDRSKVPYGTKVQKGEASAIDPSNFIERSDNQVRAI